MTLEEALHIAKILEQDDVIGPVGMACRVLLKRVQELEQLKSQSCDDDKEQ